MKSFTCHCGNSLHFENTQCLVCGRTLGFLSEHGIISALEPIAGGKWHALHPKAADGTYKMCNNYKSKKVCNWMVNDPDTEEYCLACRFNNVIPDLSNADNEKLWRRIERAKRRLFFTLQRLGLQLISKKEDPVKGLAFNFLADADVTGEFADTLGHAQSVITGHSTGLITINIAEADPSAREEMREKMSEQYRTLLGHFRHEIGHYYWDVLIKESDWLESYRSLFGDERQDYTVALQKYYDNGPPHDWEQNYISAYASAHPWEDWGETWAHYLHIFDTVETAHDLDFAIQGIEMKSPPSPKKSKVVQMNSSPYADISSFDNLLRDWGRLTIVMNALSRSMGQNDAYPFVLSPKAAEKLRFVHSVIVSNAN